MGKTPSRTNKKTSESRGENSKKPQSLTESINEKVNAAEETAKEIEERDKPKQENSSKTVSKEDYDKLTEKYNALAKELDTFKQENNTYYTFNKDLQQRLFEAQDAHDAVLKQYNDLNKLFEEYKSKQPQETAKNASEPNVEESQVDTIAQTEEPKAANSENFEETKTNTSEPKAEEVKTDNSGTTEETVTPETGEAKVEGEPKVNTEQAQATQESTKKANARPGTGEATKDNVMSPEDAFKFFNDKKNYERASTVFKTPSFDRYIDSATGKWIPRSYFDAFNARDGINPKKFTFEHFKAKIPEDPGKQLTPEEETANIYNKNKAEEDYDKRYKSFNTGFKAYLRKHPKLEKIVKTGEIVGGVGILYGIGQMLYDAYRSGQNDKDEVQDIAKRLNDDDPEYSGSNNGNNSPEEIAAQLKGADESTGTPEDNSGTIEQAIAEQTPANNVEPEKSQVAANAATPTNTKANNAPASTAKSAPTKNTTQGLPPVVVNNTPPANAGSKGMTYSQRVEAGQTPQEGSMTYNANNPDMVTAGLIDAMNQNPQAGSDAIGYGDLYDQNFIDYWAKRNPNLAFGVSQGRR